MKYLLVIFGLITGISLHAAEAKVSVEQVKVGSSITLRVGGNYKVEDVEKVDEKTFRITFRAATESGRFDTLILDSDHLHVAVTKGTTIRLSAEILKDNGKSAEVAQLVIFLPSKVGQTPVWLLSNKAPLRDLRATDYLKMHAPINDYFVL